MIEALQSTTINPKQSFNSFIRNCTRQVTGHYPNCQQAVWYGNRWFQNKTGYVARQCFKSGGCWVSVSRRLGTSPLMRSSWVEILLSLFPSPTGKNLQQPIWCRSDFGRKCPSRWVCLLNRWSLNTCVIVIIRLWVLATDDCGFHLWHEPE